MPELKPCPHCGGTDISLFLGFYGRDMYAVRCGGCCEAGPPDNEPGTAVRRWNALPRALRRTATPPTEDGQYYWALGMNLMWFVVRVVEINGEMYAMMPGSEVECPISDFVEWAGPIAPPGEA